MLTRWLVYAHQDQAIHTMIPCLQCKSERVFLKPLARHCLVFVIYVTSICTYLQACTQVPVLAVNLNNVLQAKAGRKFRYNGHGTVETLIVKYLPSSKVVKGTGTWAFHG